MEVSGGDGVELNLEVHKLLEQLWRELHLDDGLFQKSSILLFVLVRKGDCVLINELSLLIHDISTVDGAVLKWELLIELGFECVNTFWHTMENMFFLRKVAIELIGVFHLLESFVIFQVYAESLIDVLRWVQILEEHIVGWTDTQNLELSFIASSLDQTCLECVFLGFELLLDFFLLCIANLDNLENGQAVWLELCWDNHFEVGLPLLLIVEMSLLENVGWHIVEG